MFLASAAHAVTAQSYIVVEQNGSVLLEHNADDVRPIASITKLITTRSSAAYDPNEEIEVTIDDVRAGHMRSTPLRAGKKYTRALLTELALVSSDNVAAIALGRTTSIPPMLLPETVRINEASGLDPTNVGSARDLAALANDLTGSELARMSVQPIVHVGDRVRPSTNPLINKAGWDFQLQKTGFINAAGGCLVAVLNVSGRLLTFVILGSRDVPARWRDLYELRKKVDPESEFAAPLSRVTKSKPRYKSAMYKKRRKK